jgi:superfamily II DNA or RNA helicase
LKLLAYADAKQYVHKLKLKSSKDWIEYCKSGNKPKNIPHSPYRAYKTYWKNWSEWLGTITPREISQRPFEQAREFVHSLGLKTGDEWNQYCKSGKKPVDIPSHPNQTYKSNWKGIGDWLGTNRVANSDKQFLPFLEARKFASSLGLKNARDWEKYRKSGKKPDDIPTNPSRTYKKDWKGYGDWLGTGTLWPHDIRKQIRPYLEARKFTRSLGLKSRREWDEYCKSGKKPEDIPSAPHWMYKKNWKGYGDWIGTGTIAAHMRKYRSFEEARNFVIKLRLKNEHEWRKYLKSGKKPDDIPADPRIVYKKEWKGIGDWLGSGSIASRNRKYRPFEEAREFVRSLRLTSADNWFDYCKSGKKPADIPTGLTRVYKDDWKGMGDWLGTGYIAKKDRQYRPYEEAKKFVHSLNLTGADEWLNYCKSGEKPKDIPTGPVGIYKNEWKGWWDWLGHEDSTWTIYKVKGLLRDLIGSKVIYEWDEAVLYSFLLRKGVLSLYNGNRHSNFFKNLIEASKTERGKKTIEEYAYSNSETPPDISVNAKTDASDSEEIVTASLSDLSNVVEKTDALDYGDINSVEQILEHTNMLESINVDEEAMQFYLDYSVDELWRSAFKNEAETVRKLKQAGKNGNKYHDTVIDTFLEDYEGSTKLKISSGYSFPYAPTLMQRYVAYKVTSLPYFGNFSGTGSGKTLSAILASRVIESRFTVIVCPNDVVEQWKSNILDTFPNSKVITGKDAFYIEYSKKEYQYAVLNYDKFSQEDSPNLIIELAKQKVDFIILDEIHFTKIRNEEEVSQRRKNLDGLMTGIRNVNSNVKVLGLSATPVVNNLREGRSLLELITGKIYDDVAVRPTIPNAVTLYEKLSTISVRELPRYSIDVDTNTIDVTAKKPAEITIRHLKSNPLAIEKFLTDARIPEIVRLIDGQTIIYTEYVEDIIQNLSNAVDTAGYSYALYTGYDRSGLTRFLNKKVQVLIASRPLSVGVDGLQHICNRLIINTLPWTNAQYQQLIGRLVRKGQIRDVVHVYLVKASIGGYQYDDLKWKRIQFKRTLADCAVDGRLPEKNLVTPQQAAMEAVRWLERLERGEISTVVRRDLNVELTPVEIRKRVIKYGDFTKLNSKINSENSDTTHYRILKDPKEWDEYHRQYREARKSWPIIPFDEIIKRISQLSPRLLIGDFGCGEAEILEKFGEKRVYSFDHVAINNNVTACDIRSVPLPDEAIDIAVFSLSLMGRNWSDYIKEAKRCLATNGYLLIAETTKSMKGRLSKLKEVIEQQGFDIYNEEEKGDFTFVEAREL